MHRGQSQGPARGQGTTACSDAAMLAQVQMVSQGVVPARQPDLAEPVVQTA